MAKVTRVGGRGTTRRKTDTSKKSTFSGDSYKEFQQVEVLVAEKQKVNPLNLSIFSPTVLV